MCPEPRRERDRGGHRQQRRVLLVAPVDPAFAAAPPARTRPAPPVAASPRARAAPAGRRDARPPSPPLVRPRRLAAGPRPGWPAELGSASVWDRGGLTWSVLG